MVWKNKRSRISIFCHYTANPTTTSHESHVITVKDSSDEVSLDQTLSLISSTTNNNM